MDCSTPGFPVLHHLPELGQTHVHWVGDAIQPSLSSPSLPVFNFPSIKVFSNESALCIKWPTHWSFSFSISPSNEYSGLICFKDWLVWSSCCPRDSQESSAAPQFESTNSLALNLLYGPDLTSIHDYWKNHSFDCTDLCQQGDVSAFYTLSIFVIAFLPKSKHLLISWL